jgi:adenosylcobinamide-phosphate synthase
MLEFAGILFAAFLLDLFFGDPPYRFHPIRIIGHCISLVEGLLRRLKWDRKGGGYLLVLCVEGMAVMVFITLRYILGRIHAYLGLCLDIFICYSCLALKDLIGHIQPVIRALEKGDLAEARERIGMVVGREVGFLHEAGISRAGVETLAENVVDGFLSPLFWFLTGGLLGYALGFHPVPAASTLLLAFKAASTMDSMVGHKDRAYIDLGWAAARLDDIMNFIPARLSLILLFLGACAARLHPLDGLRVGLRDRLKHDSPNAAHGESFVAGALHVRLGGPVRYKEGVKDKPWLGEAYPDPGPAHVRRAAVLVQYTAWISMAAALLVVLLMG